MSDLTDCRSAWYKDAILSFFSPVVIPPHAYGYFAFKDLGPTKIKGVEEALSIYEVLGVGALRTRLQVSARRGLTLDKPEQHPTPHTQSGTEAYFLKAIAIAQKQQAKSLELRAVMSLARL